MQKQEYLIKDTPVKTNQLILNIYFIETVAAIETVILLLII
jgi:hypothetical protein